MRPYGPHFLLQRLYGHSPQLRLHVAAGQIYDHGGSKAGRRLWDALKGQEKTMSHQELLAFLAAKDTTMGNMVRFWERDMIR